MKTQRDAILASCDDTQACGWRLKERERLVPAPWAWGDALEDGASGDTHRRWAFVFLLECEAACTDAGVLFAMPDWTRSFPDADHRWVMALRPVSEARDFFAQQDASGAMLAERALWLAEDVEAYAALLPEGEAAVMETLRMAQAWGQVHDDDGGDGGQSPSHAMLKLGHVWEPDAVWMHPDETGTHRLAGGVVCFPSSWALREKLGRMMAEVHAPVPALNAELGRQIDTFLQRMTPGAVWRRENWSLSRDGELNHHPSHQRPRLDASITMHEVWIRLEHQLLMKLPASGSVLFGIRIEVASLSELMRDLEATARLARLVATMSEAAAVYKGLATVRGALLGILDRAR